VHLVRHESDVETVSQPIRLYGIPPTHTYLMFDGTTRDRVTAGTATQTRSITNAVMDAVAPGTRRPSVSRGGQPPGDRL
jgi:hypothetical protein